MKVSYDILYIPAGFDSWIFCGTAAVMLNSPRVKLNIHDKVSTRIALQ